LLIPHGTVQRLYVPADAVKEVGQLTYVWVVDKDGHAQRRFVKLGGEKKDGLIPRMTV
jgi:hypothetical protein